MPAEIVRKSFFLYFIHASRCHGRTGAAVRGAHEAKRHRGGAIPCQEEARRGQLRNGLQSRDPKETNRKSPDCIAPLRYGGLTGSGRNEDRAVHEEERRRDPEDGALRSAPHANLEACVVSSTR